jgi:hypothetical protein
MHLAGEVKCEVSKVLRYGLPCLFLVDLEEQTNSCDIHYHKTWVGWKDGI